MQVKCHMTKLIKFSSKPIKEKSFVRESVIFILPYETNGNHSMETIKSRPSNFEKNSGKVLSLSLEL